MARSSDSPLPDAPSPTGESTAARPRRTSFSFLNRSKSKERGLQEDSLRSNDRDTVVPKRSFSNGRKLVKKHIQREVEEVLRQAKEDIPEVPPIIPTITQQPQMQTFGGENARPSIDTRPRAGSNAYKSSLDMGRSAHDVPVPPVPGSRSESVDPYARTESMTNRGRYSYASSFVSVNGPRKVRRRKDPTPFNILVIGATNSGKTSFIDFLRTSCALPARKQRQSIHRQNSVLDEELPKQTSISAAFQYHYLETEFGDGERVGLTLWDSESLEKNVVDLQLREVVSFIESKFEETYSEENKLIRSPVIRDTHIHCVFLVLDPVRLDLTMAAAKRALMRSNPANGTRIKDNNPFIEAQIMDEALDLQVLRVLKGKTAVIPVISKADVVTTAHMNVLKKSVWNALKKNDLDPLEAIGLELDDSEESEESENELRVPSAAEQSTSPAPSAKTEESDIVAPKPADNELPPLPLSILTPDPPDIHHNEAEKMPGNVGRSFAWGFADPYDATHCDFIRLKEIVLGDWRAELREKSRDVWYENWRTSRLKGTRTPGAASRPSGNKINTQRDHLPPALTVGTGRGPPIIREHRSAQKPTTAGNPRPNPAAYNPPRQGNWRSASGQRDPSSVVRGPQSSTTTSDMVTALPQVKADEVGVAR